MDVKFEGNAAFFYVIRGKSRVADLEQMAPEVFFTVCYGDQTPPSVIQELHQFTPALLKGFCRHRVRSVDYPAVIPEEGHDVRGVLATGLTDANIAKLDDFEGDEYQRIQVKVHTLEECNSDEVVSGTKEAFVYVFLNHEQLEKKEWDYEQFRRDKMRTWTRGGHMFADGKWLKSHLLMGSTLKQFIPPDRDFEAISRSAV